MKEGPRKQNSHEKEKEGKKSIPCLSLFQSSDPDTCNPNLQNIPDDAEHYIQAVSWDGGMFNRIQVHTVEAQKELGTRCIMYL